MLLFCYNLLLPLALIITFPFYLRRMLKRGGYAKDFLQRFGIYSPRLMARLSHHDWTWIRAVSVGEIMLALRLVEEMKRQSPEFRVVISTTTSTGYALAKQRTGARDWLEVVYSPIDFYPIVNLCWKKIRPRQAVLIDSDLWPSFLALAEANGCPVYLANARLSPRSERRYAKLRSISKTLFWRHLRTLFAQDRGDAQRWRGLGISPDRIIVAGSMKYDTEDLDSEPKSHLSEWLAALGIDRERPILLGGSTHPGEEELLLTTFQALLTDFPGLFLILVPRHAERTPEIVQLLRASKISFALRSEPKSAFSPSVLLVNTTGELRDWYATATVVVVGKSFSGVGGQNPVEPIMAKKPVIVGPHMENFQYIIDELRKAGGIIQLRSADALASTIADLLRNRMVAASLVSRASKLIAQHRGTIRRTAAAILEQRP
jgi:3-deoxy-D-manno-octulosonic-acid transferase